MLLTLLLAASPGATLASGHHFTCALAERGTVSCWGANEAGQLGDGTRETRLSPVRVLGLSGATDLACGSNHACVVTAKNEVLCWGNNGAGGAGDPVELFLPAPKKVEGLPPVKRVFAGHFTTCAITTDERLYCWGRNLTAQLGFTRPSPEVAGQPTPVKLPQLSNVRSVAIGEGHVCALAGEGDVWCWGSNDHGCSGGKGPLVVTPNKVVGDAVAIAVTNIASFAVRKNGTLTWWGSWQRDADFQQAKGLADAADTDVQALFSNRFTAYLRRGASDWSFPKSGVSPLLPSVDLTWAKELVAGDNHACGRGHDGSVRCWGWNREGVGTGSAAAVKTPTVVSLDAPEKQPVVRRPDRAETCSPSTAAPPAPPQPPPHPQCGNGTRDVIGQSGGTCAPCMPGRSCPCAPLVEVREPCDGDDLGAVSCESLQLGSGQVKCSARCTLDTSGCTPASTVPAGSLVVWPKLPPEKRPHRGLALAARGKELGVAWGAAEGCGQAVFARFSSELTLTAASVPFGRPNTSRVQLAATASGWLAALGDVGDTTSVYALGADGKAGPERAAFFGRPVFLEAAGPDGPWALGLSTRREHSYLGGLTVVLLDSNGNVLAERVVFGPSAQTAESVESLPPGADQAAAIGVPGGFLIARSQLVPGSERGGVVVARMSKSGAVESKALVGARGVSPFWLPGDSLRLGWLRTTTGPAQAALFAVDAVSVDARGLANGEVQTLTELTEAEWLTTGAVSLTSAAVLVPRLDASASTLQSGVSTRLSVIEPPKLRMTLVEGKGVGPSRLTTWGEAMVAGWLFQQDGTQRLGLARVLPAASR
ncbi:MAG: hypothetical protein JNM17_38170 [Archangium sp.]|nr:hypothetical protein [Archangium sp.]